MYLPANISMIVGKDTKIITAEIIADNEQNGGVIWSYDDPDNCLNHANIEASNTGMGSAINLNVFLTPKAVGTVTVTATPRDDSSKAITCTVHILPMGDITLDTNVDIMDARIAKRAAMKDVSLSDDQINAGDLDGNGKITINEARKIKRAVLKEIRLN